MSERMAYIGICQKCGAAYFAAVIDPRWTKDTAKQVAQVIRRGDAIERISVENARVRLQRCMCHEKPPPPEPLFAEAGK